MNAEIDYKKLAQAMTPIHRDALWTKSDIAYYLRRSKRYVDELIRNDPDFPRGLRIGGGNLLYRAGEIMDYYA